MKTAFLSAISVFHLIFFFTFPKYVYNFTQVKARSFYGNFSMFCKQLYKLSDLSPKLTSNCVPRSNGLGERNGINEIRLKSYK